MLAANLYAASASAQVLHVWGPEGNGVERHVLVVVEQADGGCAPLDDRVTVAVAEPGGRAEWGDAAGSCARWVRITGPRRPSVTLRVAGAGSEVSAPVPMGDAPPIEVRARRTGERIEVTIANPPADPTVVEAVWAGGRAPLQAKQPGRFAGRVPPNDLVAVLARAGARVGADAIAPTSAHPAAAATLVLPSGRALPAGGTAVTAAYVVLADRLGHLSSDVPLHATSKRGRLRGLTWIRPGVAVLTMSALSGARTVDLEVTAGGVPAPPTNLAVDNGWPLAVEIVAPANGRVGETVEVRLRAGDLGGDPIEPARLRVRCAGEPVAAVAGGVASCALADPPEQRLVAGVLVGNRMVPLAADRIRVQAREQPAQTDPAPVPPSPPALVAAVRRTPGRRLRVSATARGGVDLSLRPIYGAGVSLVLPLRRSVAIEAELYYAASPLAATGRLPVTDSLDGTAHAWQLLVGARARLASIRSVAITARLGLGGAYVHEAARVGSADASTNGWRIAALAAVGPTIPVGRLELDVALGASAWMALGGPTWNDAPAMIFLDVTGALAL